jgi:transposase
MGERRQVKLIVWTETLRQVRHKNMVRNPCLSKSISDAGWNQFLTILTSKAEEQEPYAHGS